VSAKPKRKRRKPRPQPPAFETRPPFGFAAHPAVGAPRVEIHRDDDQHTRRAAASAFRQYTPPKPGE